MAELSAVLTRVEIDAYLREIARDIADTIIAGADVNELLLDPQSFIDDILATMLYALGPLTTQAAQAAQDFAEEIGMQVLDEQEVAQLTQQSHSSMFALLPALLGTAYAGITDILAGTLNAGVTEDALARALNRPATGEALLARMRSTMRNAAQTLVTEVANTVIEHSTERYANQTATTQYSWFTTSKNPCEDSIENSCAPRHGMVLLYKTWEEIGLPRSPILLCSQIRANCKCFIEPAWKKNPLLLNPVDIRPAIAAGRQRAMVEIGARRRQ
jgi:hypothetical protein